jgi:hypothetical protein
MPGTPECVPIPADRTTPAPRPNRVAGVRALRIRTRHPIT